MFGLQVQLVTWMTAVYFMIAIAGLRSNCGCCGGSVALGGKDVLSMLLTMDVSTLLILIKDCGNKQTKTC